VPRPAWKFALLSALTALSADIAVAARPAPVKDFSRQVEVVVGGRLRETAKGQGEVTVTLWNKTDSAVAGPIFLVIEETGIANVQVGSHTVETSKGKPVFELLSANEELLPGGMTTSFPLAFAIPEGLTREEANKLQLVTKVFGRQGAPDAAKMAREKQAREDADFATRGKSYNQSDLDAAIALQRQVTPDLMKKPDVLGTGITEDANGNLALRVYTETRAAAKTLPGSVGNLTVSVEPVPGGFRGGPVQNSVTYARGGQAQSKRTRDQGAKTSGDKSGAGKKTSASPSLVTLVDPTQRFDRPVPIGVSTFNAETGTCASGTIGVRVKDPGGKLYAISNSHVWGDMGLATVGQLIVQPGLGDNNCLAQEDVNTIGILADFTAFQNSITTGPFFRPGLTFNFIDAALMEVSNSTNAAGETVPSVGVATPSDGYGVPSTRVLPNNRINLQVQKYGRTTGYTRGYTSVVNTMVTIGGAVQNEDTEWFRVDEFLGLNQYPSLGAPGDSGSLIVTLEDKRPVSLLFAGGGAGPLLKTQTLGIGIRAVLSRFNVAIDDGTDADVHVGGTSAIGLTGRSAIAMGNIARRDLGDFVGSDTTGLVVNELLPPYLHDRVKPNRRPLIPVNNASGLPPGVLP